MKKSETNPEVVWLDFETLRNFTVDLFCAIGVPRDEADICADVLVTADQRGIDSHGVGRLKPIYYDRIVNLNIQQPKTEFEIVRDHKATAVVDGHHGMGMVVAHRSMQMAIEKAKAHGLGMVCVRNSTHYGIAGYYPIMATACDMIGLSGTNARPSIAPTFGVENMLGTNPLVFAFPTDEPYPFTNDYATSIVQRGKIEQYAREGKPVPEGLVISSDGQVMTDADEILKALVEGRAALLPIGGAGEETAGYKGYGFATVVEILSASLQQGHYLKQLTGLTEDGAPRPYGLGHFFMAIDVNCFIEPPAFKKTTGDILRALRAARKVPGEERIYTCGEKEYNAIQERRDKGAPLNHVLQQQLTQMRNEQGLSQYQFPWE